MAQHCCAPGWHEETRLGGCALCADVFPACGVQAQRSGLQRRSDHRGRQAVFPPVPHCADHAGDHPGTPPEGDSVQGLLGGSLREGRGKQPGVHPLYRQAAGDGRLQRGAHDSTGDCGSLCAGEGKVYAEEEAVSFICLIGFVTEEMFFELMSPCLNNLR